MTDSLHLSDLRSPSLEFDRQCFLQKWFIQSRPHMVTTCTSLNVKTAANNNTKGDSGVMSILANTTPSGPHENKSFKKLHRKSNESTSNPNNQVLFLMSNNDHIGAPMGSGGSAHNKISGITPKSSCLAAIGGAGHHLVHLGHNIEGRKPKLRRFNSHDTNSNMFSVADFENARLARRNEIEMKQRLQRRLRSSSNGVVNAGVNERGAAGSVGITDAAAYGLNGGNSGLYGVGGDFSTSDSKLSKNSNNSQHEPLPADLFFLRFSMPSVVRISYTNAFPDETLQSTSSNGSLTATSHSTGSAGSNVTTRGVCITPIPGENSDLIGTCTSSTASSSSNINPTGIKTEKKDNLRTTDVDPSQTADSYRELNQMEGGVYLLYKFMNQRCIYHGHNTKTALTNRKKVVLIPQEFPGHFSLVDDKGLPTATQYTSIIQLVRERVFKFISVDVIPAFAEYQVNDAHLPADGRFPLYSSTAQSRPQYVRTTAHAGEVYRLIAVFEAGKQGHNAICGSANNIGSSNGSSNVSSKLGNYGREKEKGRYAQLMNDGRKVFYVPLSTKGKFYEVEPGVPIILQRSGGKDRHKKINPDCVYRITDLITPKTELPLSLRYISGPNTTVSGIPECLNITKVTKENFFIACPINDIEMQRSLNLHKLYVTKEMNLLKNSLGFDSDKSMWSDPKIQKILKFCQFNCDLFLQNVEIDTLHRSKRINCKQRKDGLKLLNPLHFPKLLRREKTSISAHEKEDSIIFLTKSDLANIEAKETSTRSLSKSESTGSGIRISEKMKVFQSTKKKWFHKQDKHSDNSLSTLDMQIKRMSMERYTDMSKLLQERFGDNSIKHTVSVQNPDGSASDPSCSDTDTTVLATIVTKLKKLEQATDGKHNPTETIEYSESPPVLQKSLSLQDITGQRSTQGTVRIAECSSETELGRYGAIEPTSFITEKLFSEFHVKTRQYSKSSSSLHQSLHFALPQKMQLNEHKRTLDQLKRNFGIKSNDKLIDFNIGALVTSRRSAGGLSILSETDSYARNTSLIPTPKTSSLIEDELPYSSVRDSLVHSNNFIITPEIEQINETNWKTFKIIGDPKENIYAEICHEASVMGGIPNSKTRDTITVETQSTQISASDDFGDYASLSCSASELSHNQKNQHSILGNAISRVKINCAASPVSYNTVILNDEPLGEKHLENRLQRETCDLNSRNNDSRSTKHITTVELEGIPNSKIMTESYNINGSPDAERLSYIYNTLK